MIDEQEPGALPRRKVKCPTHDITSTFSPVEEEIDDMIFHFIEVDVCKCLFAFAIDSPRIAEVKEKVTRLWNRARDLSDSGRRDLAATLRRKALAISGIDIWIPPDHFVDPAQVDRALAAVRETVELAAVLGRCPVSLTLPSPGAEATDFGGVVESLTDHAMRHGVHVANHAVAVSSLHDLGIGIDPAALLGHGRDPARQVVAHAPRLISARLCDLLRSGVRGPVGNSPEARFDVLAYRVALTTAAYSRPVVVDGRQWPDPLRGLEQTREVWSALDAGNTV